MSYTYSPSKFYDHSVLTMTDDRNHTRKTSFSKKRGAATRRTCVARTSRPDR
jgi:hypothetical protein